MAWCLDEILYLVQIFAMSQRFLIRSILEMKILTQAMLFFEQTPIFQLEKFFRAAISALNLFEQKKTYMHFYLIIAWQRNAIMGVLFYSYEKIKSQMQVET
jgi:hypothetical protein